MVLPLARAPGRRRPFHLQCIELDFKAKGWVEGRTPDSTWRIVAFEQCKVNRRSLIGKNPADETTRVADDPSAAGVSADREAAIGGVSQNLQGFAHCIGPFSS